MPEEKPDMWDVLGADILDVGAENQTQDHCKSSACSYPLSYISYFGTEVSTYCISSDPLMILFDKQQTKFAQPVT